jgi:DNA-binding CsgD family transcriptional regulator
LRTEPAELTLVEREADVERLGEAVERVLAGDGAFVALEGPAGIGKSRLLEAVRGRAAESGMKVLAARGGELERDFAYGVVRQLFEAELATAPKKRREQLLSGAAALAAPALGLGRGAQAQAPGDISFPVIHGLYWLAVNLAAEGPLLLEVDDVHWADSPTLRFLMHLVPRLEGTPILVTAGMRPGEPASDLALLAKLTTDPNATILRPAPLSEAGVNTVITNVMGTAPVEAFTDACHAASGGNPFLVRELLGALRADGFTPDEGGAARVLQVGPDTVSRSLVLRLSRLPRECGPLAHAVAVLGARADPAHAALLAEISPEAGGTAADALAAVEILEPTRPLTFAHPVVREAIYADIAPSLRAQLHARAARVLSGAGVSSAELAPHLLATDPAGDADAVAALREAASDALGQGAADLARRYLDRAVAEPPADEQRPEVLAELGTAEWLSGEPVSAAAHLREAVENTDDPALRAERAVTLARATFYTGQVPAAVEIVEREAERAEGATGEAVERLRAEVYGLGLISALTIPSVVRRIDALEEPPGDTIGELLTLAHLGAREWLGGTAARAIELCERALRDGTLLEKEGMESIAVYETAWVLIWADRHELARDVIASLLDQSTARGSVFGHATARALGAVAAFSEGRMTAVEAEARAGIELSEPPAFSRPALYTMLALALIERGAYDEAEDAVTESGCGPFLPAMAHMNMAFYARARLRLAQGRNEEALADFLELGDRHRQCYVAAPAFPWRLGAAEVHVRQGNHDAAMQLAEDQLEDARRWGTPSAIGVALHTQGLAEGADGSPTLAEAAMTLAGSPARLDYARALVDLGAALRRSGSRAEARDPLREGLEVARSCGATVLAERAHEELVTAGARPRRLMFSGLESLTASERRVAHMAADGLTNRQVAEQLFVTVKTVENHLTRVYSKLDVQSRDGLPEALGATR